MKTTIEKNILKSVTYEPLTKNNWNHFVQLFGEKGAADNCWCMFYRLSKTDYNQGKAGGNKEAMHQLVMQDKFVGILAFYEGHAIAWCAFAPRKDYLKLEHSKNPISVDDQPVWSIPCFYIDKSYRRLGITSELLKASIQYAKENNIKIIEAYPAIPSKEKVPDSSAWIGFYKTFEEAGFEIVDQTKPNRPVVRYYTDKK